MSHAPIESYILHSEANGVLPLGPVCHDGCVFCSHRNASGDPEANGHLRRFANYRRTTAEALEHAAFLEPEKRVVIGESATKLAEGEPFMFPGFNGVLEAVRKRIGKGRICITTSGGFFSEEFFGSVERLAPLEISVSINAVDPAVRDRIVRDKRSAGAIGGLYRLMKIAREGGPFPGALRVNASLMAVNGELTPAASIVSAVSNLRAAGGLDVIRVYLPRFAEKLFNEFFQSKSEYLRYRDGIVETLAGVNAADATPVIVEPAAPPDLSVTIAGVVCGSRAKAAEIKAGDGISAVNGKKPLTRSHAHSMMSKATGRLSLAISPADGSPPRTVIFEGFDGATEGSAGMLFIADASPAVIEGIVEAEKRLKAADSFALLATTPLAIGYMESLLAKNGLSGIRPFAVENSTFGGIIDCAGLLALRDIELGLEGSGSGGGPAELIVSAAMFDHLGRDVRGKTIEESPLSEKFRVRAV